MIDEADLPEGWRLVPLGLATKPSSEKTDPSSVPDATYIGLEHIESHTRRILHCGKGLHVKSAKAVFRTGDVLYGKLRPYLNKVTVAPFDGIASTDILVFPESPDVLSEYLARIMNSLWFVEQAHHGSAGMELPRTSWAALKDIKIPLPPESEQRQIIQLLDQVDQRRDAAATRLTKARHILASFRRAVLMAACSGHLTGDWRESHPNVLPVDINKIAARHHGRMRRQESPIDFEMPDLPESYVVAPIGAAAVTIEYGTSRRADGGIGDVPVLRMGNIQDGSLNLSDLKYLTRDNEVERLLLRDGDLLFNRTNSPELVGKSAVWRGSQSATFASYLIRVRFHEEAAIPEFVNYWINSAWGRIWARQVKTDGVSQSNINGTKLGAMPVPLPPVEEQREIVRRVEGLLQGSAEILTKVNATSALLERTGQAALAKAFRGELVS